MPTMFDQILPKISTMGVSGGIFIYEGPCKSLLICDNYLNMNLFCKKQQVFVKVSHTSQSPVFQSGKIVYCK